MNIEKRLLSLCDPEYKAFQSALIPTVPESRIIGVRIPEIRRLAREISGSNTARKFMACLPHKTYDENNLHASLICLVRDYDECMILLQEFLKHVDNWATCDMMSPKALSKNLDKTLEAAYSWMESEHVFTCRFGILTFMRYFSGENFFVEYLEKVSEISIDDYYVRMMKAWYYSTLLAKHYEQTLTFLKKGTLDSWVMKKSIQKACESRRITAQQKSEIRHIFD